MLEVDVCYMLSCLGSERRALYGALEKVEESSVVRCTGCRGTIYGFATS